MHQGKSFAGSPCPPSQRFPKFPASSSCSWATPDYTEPIQQVHLPRATFVHPKSLFRPMGLQPEPKSRPSHPRGTCGHWRGSRAVPVLVVAAAAVALWVLLLCVVLLSIPLKLPHGSASRGGFVTFPPPSHSSSHPQVPPSHTTHRSPDTAACCCRLSWIQAFPSVSSLELLLCGLFLS